MGQEGEAVAGNDFLGFEFLRSLGSSGKSGGRRPGWFTLAYCKDHGALHHGCTFPTE
jgi:hypothetical protein